MLQARGYSIETFDALQTGYHNKPTPAQIASYDVHVVNIIKRGDAAALQALLQAGLSSNPCNVFGDSLLHTICRTSQHPALLQVMLQNGADIHISDDYGKTVLHDACWAAQPNFTLVTLLLDHDPCLLHLRDARGALPLSYVPQRHTVAWVEFLQDHKDRFWPPVATPRPLSRLLSEAPHQRPVPDPPLPLHMVKMLAAGKMSPKEVEFLWADAESDDEYSTSAYDDDEEDNSTLCSDDYDGLEPRREDDEASMSSSHLSDDDSVVEGFEDELTKSDSHLDGLLGIQSPQQYIATMPFPVASVPMKESSVPEVLEVVSVAESTVTEGTSFGEENPEVIAEKLSEPTDSAVGHQSKGMRRESVCL